MKKNMQVNISTIGNVKTVPKRSFTYTYEVLYDSNNSQESDSNNFLKSKPLQKNVKKQNDAAISIENEKKPGHEFLLNPNYTYEADVHEHSRYVETEVTEKLHTVEEDDIITSPGKQMESALENDMRNTFVPAHQILYPAMVNVDIPMPLPDTTPSQEQLLCETASRLLFQIIHWALKIPMFKSMPYPGQVTLLRNSWSDLFILALVQYRDHINLSSLLDIITINLQNCLSQDYLAFTQIKQLTKAISKIKEITKKFKKLDLNTNEFEYLKLCTLFGTNHSSESLQNIIGKIPEQRLSFQRSSNLFHELSSLKGLVPDYLRKLFFSGLIGSVPIDSVIPYILSMQIKNIAGQ
eukprot:GFUD01063873.1.p1 GENE.GFUD01063873.1~~GFUD01063873.1.p1  ORF type:complete len:352 (-),score=77.88 GFUD01063873.1:299-1354(-)